MILKKLKATITIMRPGNGTMAVLGVFLGSWLANSQLEQIKILILSFTALTALSFGNVINDIKDLEGDKINHPERPLPKKTLSIKEAYFLSIILAILSLAGAAYVSFFHFLITIIPIGLLSLYTYKLKAVPLVGNILVSLLVAYTLIYGAINSTDFKAVIFPAILAFLLNLEREIIKDFQDMTGDLQTGVKTTATLSPNSIRILFFLLSVSYLVILPLPSFTQFFSNAYLILALAIVLPLHLIVSAALLKLYNKFSSKKISGLIKLEMLLGLAALSIDKIINI